LPQGFTLAEAVTLPNNFITVFHTLTTDLDLETPWPKPENYVPRDADQAILVWGGSSSVGQFAIQILRYYGYTNVLATASRKHHEKLCKLGAREVFDYNEKNVISDIARACGHDGIPLVFDCIGSKFGSIAHISKITKSGARVAILLPVIVRDSTETEDPEYEMDVKVAAAWGDGVDARGVRTHFYLNVCSSHSPQLVIIADTLQNEFFKYHLQLEIMPALLKQGIVTPQKQKIVEGATMLERAQKAMNMLRRKEASMERLVWQVSDSA
jgi:hypothetical protein